MKYSFKRLNSFGIFRSVLVCMTGKWFGKVGQVYKKAQTKHTYKWTGSRKINGIKGNYFSYGKHTHFSQTWKLTEMDSNFCVSHLPKIIIPIWYSVFYSQTLCTFKNVPCVFSFQMYIYLYYSYTISENIFFKMIFARFLIPHLFGRINESCSFPENLDVASPLITSTKNFTRFNRVKKNLSYSDAPWPSRVLPALSCIGP